jgi:hypothetical protein
VSNIAHIESSTQAAGFSMIAKSPEYAYRALVSIAHLFRKYP